MHGTGWSLLFLEFVWGEGAGYAPANMYPRGASAHVAMLSHVAAMRYPCRACRLLVQKRVTQTRKEEERKDASNPVVHRCGLLIGSNGTNRLAETQPGMPA